MRVPRLLAFSAGAAAVLAGTLLPAGTAAAAGQNYVALGDSYSAGVGAGSYDSSSGSCSRSTKAYPQLWANANAPASFKFVACSGATTGSVTSGQLSALTSTTSLASITVGGNDAGFSSVMQTCVLSSDSACVTAVNNAKAYAQNTLPGKLDALYSAMRGKAPSAHFVVLGYPHLYYLNSGFCIGLSNTKRTALNSAADALDSTISSASSRAGFTFSDVRPIFNTHELCSGDDWLNSVTYPIGNSYHPTALGQSSGYLPGFKNGVASALRVAAKS
ncbi:SGNH/GDSL hydrolase family protein [Actinomadura rupiterrae]|uniref:SGNH/GDSL hydrolase family protein n=1 Tax=Actinomadura rupiterrae TaxID=559627 RepID=UPI002646D896|nr:SGNH/GDSL hydrolase family protein [Actinomadura rupiterrae]MCP2337449.1 lysophospholipase L1-like esterase [Actinomadura rupiterrae]